MSLQVAPVLLIRLLTPGVSNLGKSDCTTARSLMGKLPRAARIYVSAIVAAGAVLFAVCVPRAHIDQPILFLVLLVLAAVTARLRVQLPLTTDTSSMSVSYAVNFLALLLFDPH